jgi:sulfur-carrier protein adenylyltransferase/sulfurtransferase
VDLFRIFRRGEAKPHVVTVSAREAYDALQADKRARIVDVREPREWDATGVPQKAVRVSLGNLQRKAAEKLPGDAPVYLICASGHRSRNGGKILLELGYTQVYSVSGGIQAWKQAGLPLKKS